jgi:hypothetical protein
MKENSQISKNELELKSNLPYHIKFTYNGVDMDGVILHENIEYRFLPKYKMKPYQDGNNEQKTEIFNDCMIIIPELITSGSIERL